MATAPAPYFCFKCDKYLHPDHVQNYKCRFCNTGFIEEIIPGVNNLNDDDSRSNSPARMISSNGSNMNDINQMMGVILGGPQGGIIIGAENAGPRPTNNAASQQPGFNAGMAGGAEALLRLFMNNQRPGGPSDRTRRQAAGADGPAPRSHSEQRQRSNTSGQQNENNPGVAGFIQQLFTTPHGEGMEQFLQNPTNGQQQPEAAAPGGFISELLQTLLPNNAAIRIQVGNGGGNFNWGDFVADGNFDEIVTQILNQADGSGAHQHLTDQDLQHLPRVKVAKEQVDNEATCTTCMDQFRLNEEVAQLGCNHIFHPDCLIPWLRTRNTCPICRHVINPQEWQENPTIPLPPQFREGFQDNDELD